MSKPAILLTLFVCALHAEVHPTTLRQAVETALKQNPDFTLAHKNKYGQDYVPPGSGNPAYSRP